MGTASTMASIAGTLGMALPGTAAIPAVHADRLRAAEATGETAVALARTPLTPERILTPSAFENALRVLLAIGGSTNAIIHLTADAGRLGVPIDLTTVNRLSDETPVLVDLKPSGQHYMEDFFAAGGLGAVLRELRDRLHLDRFPGAEERGPQGRAGDAGGGLPADSHQALAGGCDGHGADLGCAHERHRIRHHRAARHPGGGRRRPTGRGAQRRPHPALGQGAPHRCAGRALGAGASRR